MKFLILLLAMSSAAVFADGARMKVTPFQTSVELGRDDVTVESAELSLEIGFCFIARDCQAWDRETRRFGLTVQQTNEKVEIKLMKAAVNSAWKLPPYHRNGCSHLIILRGRDENGNKLFGRLDPGGFGDYLTNCSSDQNFKDFLETNPPLQWFSAR